MSVKNVITEYVSITEQEIQDKAMMLYYIDLFEDVLTRENKVCHFTSSGFVLNQDKTKVLMVYHNIYNSWGWIGGHMDGNNDFIEVAKKEITEETGLKEMTLETKDVISLDILPVIGHYKNGEYVTPHLHLSITYLFTANEKSFIKPNILENRAVEWLDINNLSEKVAEKDLLTVYEKILHKSRAIKNSVI